MVAVANPNSTKKRKHNESKGTADDLMEKHLGTASGTHDPKGVVAKAKLRKDKKAKAKKAKQ
jgi:hypothetical protein